MSAIIKTKKKEQSIETLRGIAIILMVAGHVIGNNAERGMQVADDSWWRYAYFSFQYLRMPLFTAISGFVYALRPLQANSVLPFYKGKARRILLPLISIGTIHFLFKSFLPFTNTHTDISDIWQIYIIPFDHFWFLHAIFLIFIFIGIFDYFKLVNTPVKWFILLLCTILIRQFWVINIEFLGINGFINLLPFFILGYGLNIYKNILLQKKRFVLLFLLIFAGSFIFQQLFWFLKFSINFCEYKIISFLVAFSGISLLFYIRKEVPFLARLGYYAYGIYLFHVFGTAGSRIVLQLIGAELLPVTFIIGLIFGLGIPIVIEMILEKFTITRRIFLGLK